MSQHSHRGPSISLTVCSLGPVEESEAVLRPLRTFGPPAMDSIAPTSITSAGLLQRAIKAGRLSNLPLTGGRFYYKSHFLKHLDDTVVEQLCDAYAKLGASGFGVLLEPLDGAIRRVDPSANAYPEREADYCLLLASLRMSSEENEVHLQQVRDTSMALDPFCTGRAYVNYLDNDELERVPTAYGREIYERLRAVKKKYDPTNFFRANQNIAPAS
jgi:Berberine and berberine like